MVHRLSSLNLSIRFVRQLAAGGAVATVSFLVAGCALFSPAPTAPPPQRDVQSSTPAALASRLLVEGTEVVWEVPTEPVDGFILRYGENPSHPLREVKIPLRSLTEEHDPEHGPIFRYVIRDSPPVKPLFVAVAAFKGDKLSDFSELKEEVR